MATGDGAFLASISARRGLWNTLFLFTPDSRCGFPTQRSSVPEISPGACRHRRGSRAMACTGIWKRTATERMAGLLWIFLILTINALVFDYRDIIGDRFAGTKTIPVLLGHRRTRGLLMLLAGALVLISIVLSWLRLAGPLMPVMLTLGCSVLLFSLRRRMHPTLLSVLADILLFLPAFGELFR